MLNLKRSKIQLKKTRPRGGNALIKQQEKEKKKPYCEVIKKGKSWHVKFNDSIPTLEDFEPHFAISKLPSEWIDWDKYRSYDHPKNIELRVVLKKRFRQAAIERLTT